MVQAMILAARAESQKVQELGTGYDFGDNSNDTYYLTVFDGHHFYLSFSLSSILLLSFNGHRHSFIPSSFFLSFFLSFPLYFFVTNLWSSSFAILKYSRE